MMSLSSLTQQQQQQLDHQQQPTQQLPQQLTPLQQPLAKQQQQQQQQQQPQQQLQQQHQAPSRNTGATKLFPNCLQKKDTITSDVIFSFNGRKLVTSLILVITTIILLILLIVNFDYIRFTEASVNTSSSQSLFATSITPTSTSSLSPTFLHKPISPLIVTTTTSYQSSTTNSNNLDSGLITASSSSSSSTTPQPTTTNNSTKISDSNSKRNNSASAVLGRFENIETIHENGGTEPVTITNEPTKTAQDTAIDQLSTNFIGSDPPVNQLSGTKSSSMSSNGNETIATNLGGTNCSSPTPDRNSVPSNETSKYFDIDYAIKTFEDSMSDKNAISLHHYLNGFKELMKFFHSLGTIFLFVTSDLETKIGLLEGYRNIEKAGCNPAYLTIQSSIEYETKENLLRDTKRQSGARTILRLHRALEFLSSMMLNLSKLREDEETAPSVREAYSNTLSKHHPWTIRTIASFAMRTLPNKKLLVESVLCKEIAANETAVNEKMLMLANVTLDLFNVVDKYYEENDIKDLP